MKGYIKGWLTLVGLIPLCYSVSFGQLLEKQDQVTTFSNRIQNPIDVEVTRTQEELTFTARNKSFYLYEFELEFKVFENLGPLMTIHRTVLNSGTNRLFKLRIRNLEIPPNYSYSIRYKIANSRNDADLGFPYIIPLKPGTKTESQTWKNAATHTFKIEKGDSVYAIRKGVVTSVPSDTEGDRIAKETLEVLHSDGTIALYTGLDPESVFLKTGQRVFPGQPVGRISDRHYLGVYVYIVADNGLKSIPVVFATGNQEEKPYSGLNGITVQHPPEVIQRELSDREKKKFSKGTLYGSKE